MAFFPFLYKTPREAYLVASRGRFFSFFRKPPASAGRGLAVEGGQLVGKPAGDGGLMVGVKTTYVPGIYMVDAAKKTYRSKVYAVLRKELKKALS